MSAPQPIARMRLRYAGTCRACHAPLPAGSTAGWDRGTRTVVCLPCLDSTPAESTTPEGATVKNADAPVPDAPDPAPPVRADRNARAAADAGASLQREYERRMASREQRVKARLPRIGGLLLAIFDEADSTKAFKRGADGERTAIKRLLQSAGDDVQLLVNRRLGPGRRDGDIDILAISGAGIRIIDVKRYADATIKVERRGGLFSPRTEHLLVRGRDRTNMLDSLHRQQAAVSAALAGHPRFAATPIHAALCFVDAQFPLIGTLSIAGVNVLGPRQTAKLLAAGGQELDREAVEEVASLLDGALPPAAGTAGC